MKRRDFMIGSAAAGVVAASTRRSKGKAPTMLVPAAVKPLVISSANGNIFKNGGDATSVQKAFRMMTEGADVLDSVVAGVNIVELDPKKRAEAGRRAAMERLAEGLLRPESFYGTINCDGINSKGEICGVTTTSGLSWKIPGRVGDSPILGAGLYVDGEVGAAGSTGRGEANLYNLCSFLIVENMRKGMHPKDAGMEACRRIKANTVEKRLLNSKGNPNFYVNFYILNAKGEYAGVTMYEGSNTQFAICNESGPRTLSCEGLLPGKPED